MQLELIRHSITLLQSLAKELFGLGIKDNAEFKTWAIDNKQKLHGYFDYQQLSGMPEIRDLLELNFHPELDLVKFNYSQGAQSQLFKHVWRATGNELIGWTAPLMCCRGIIFNSQGQVIAFPHIKSFNYGKHPLTLNFPALPFEATEKDDGHLGIIFKYQDKFWLTTRGKFHSASSKIGQQMLNQYIEEKDWHKNFPSELTLCVEMIHPKMKILVDYGDQEKFIINGARHNLSFHDYSWEGLNFLAMDLKLEVCKLHRFNNINEVLQKKADLNNVNCEGLVLRFSNGLYIKVKFDCYLSDKYDQDLSYRKIMQNFADGTLKDRFNYLDEEVRDKVYVLLGELFLRFVPVQAIEIKKTTEMTDEEKQQRTAENRCLKQFWTRISNELHDPSKVSKAHFDNVCRNFVRSLHHHLTHEPENSKKKGK